MPVHPGPPALHPWKKTHKKSRIFNTGIYLLFALNTYPISFLMVFAKSTLCQWDLDSPSWKRVLPHFRWLTTDKTESLKMAYAMNHLWSFSSYQYLTPDAWADSCDAPEHTKYYVHSVDLTQSSFAFKFRSGYTRKSIS